MKHLFLLIGVLIKTMRKSTLLFILALTLSITGFSQNLLFLKNGDKMNGKLEGYKNDTVIFKVQGNNLKFKTTDIISVYFDTNFTPKYLNQELTSNEKKQAQQGVISGVVTYFFNDNYGNKPDIGAEVCIADSAKNQDVKFSTIDSLLFASYYRYLYLLPRNKRTPVDRIEKKIKEYNCDSKESFDSLDSRATNNILKLMYVSKNVTKTVVDGNGNYSIKVKPGTYYVCIKSKNRRGLSNCVTEAAGKLNINKIIVKESLDYNVSCNFGLLLNNSDF